MFEGWIDLCHDYREDLEEIVTRHGETFCTLFTWISAHYVYALISTLKGAVTCTQSCLVLEFFLLSVVGISTGEERVLLRQLRAISAHQIEGFPKPYHGIFHQVSSSFSFAWAIIGVSFGRRISGSILRLCIMT